jgi:outer membrane protein assembly factor BamB
MKFAVTTRSYDNLRSGANTQETVLTPAAVRARGIRHLFTLPLPGDARGCEAQPLIVPDVMLKDGSKHDIVYVATMANQVYAFDANDGAQLWVVELGTPVSGSQQIDAHVINDHWGILSTPVIDAQAQILYCCAWTSKDRTWQNGQHFLHAISLRDGSALHAPLNLESTSYDPGHGLAKQLFRSAERKQRAALLLANGAVFVGFGTIAESAKTARGWLIAVDTSSFKVAAAWTSTARGSGGGIWHSGAGPAADAAGHVYVLTGNGAFDGVTDFGECLVKLQYTRPSGAAPGRLAAVDWWSPWTDTGRLKNAPATAARAEDDDVPMPTNFRKDAHLARLLGADAQNMDETWGDQDFGAAGPVLASSAGVCLASNKDGILYTIDVNALGRTMPADLAPVTTAANYAKLKAAPIFYTYFPGPGFSAAPANATALNFWSGNRTHHLHGTPVLWKSVARGVLHFCWGENGNLRAWALADDGASTYLGCSAEVASPQSAAMNGLHGGMAGGMITLSANGGTDGVVWASVPYGDANVEITAGRLLAYDAAHFGTFADGSGSMPPLWDSQDWNWNFTHNKFNRLVVWNGRVYLPTYRGEVWVLGLA